MLLCFTFIVENREIERPSCHANACPVGGSAPSRRHLAMPVTPEAVVRISLYFNTNRLFAICSHQGITSPDTLSVRSSHPTLGLNQKNIPT